MNNPLSREEPESLRDWANPLNRQLERLQQREIESEALLENMGDLLEDVPLDESESPSWWDRRRRVLKEWRERK